MSGVDVIGALYQQPAVEGVDPVRLWGFHVNITPACLAEYPELQARIHQPETMQRVWAGDDPANPTETVALRFNGENAARDALGDLWPTEVDQ